MFSKDVSLRDWEIEATGIDEVLIANKTSWNRKVCNPGLAFQVLSEEIDIGLSLTCNVVVYEDPEKGETVWGVIDPEMMVQATGRTDLDVLAKSVREKLQTALDSVWA